MLKPLLQKIIDGVCEDFGRPVSLLRMLASYPQMRVLLNDPDPCIDAASVPHWHELGSPSGSHDPSGTLMGRRVIDGDGQPESFQVTRPEYAQIVDRQTISNWSCDLIDIDGFAFPTSALWTFASTDAMAEAKCPELIAEITVEQLYRNLAHDQIRIFHGTGDYFKKYQWDQRLWLINEGGSHRTASAKYIAIRLGQPVKLTGTIYTYSLNAAAIASLCNDFEMFVIPNDPKIDGVFFEAMRAFKATWLWHPMPCPYKHTKAILLPKNEKRSLRVAAEFFRAGLTDLGAHLTALAAKQ